MLRTCLLARAAAAAITVLGPGAAQAQVMVSHERPACPPEASTVAPPPPAGADLQAVEPIVCQDELEREAPPIGADDPALSQPLESVAEFEARLRAVEARPGEVAPTADPELVQPLPPLNQFDVREVELAQPDPAEAVAELHYVMRIEGLEGADGATEADLVRQFQALSALRAGGGKAANEAMLSARLTEDSKLIQRILQSEGWYDAKIDTRIDRSPAADGQPVNALLLVSAGERYKFGSIAVQADGTVPAGLIDKNLALQVGEPIVAQRIQGAEANVAVVLPQEGYPFAAVGQRDVLLDPETHFGDYTLPVTLGPRARFGGFRTAGELAFGARHVEVLARFDRGELYDSRDVDDLRQALVGTGLFSTVGVEPERTGQVNPDGTETVTMLVTQDAGPPRTLAAGAGYGTGQGLRVEGSWTHRNLFRPEGALVASALAGTEEQGASLVFRRSNAGKRDRTFQAGVEALRSRYDAFDALTGRLFVRLSYDSTPIWRKTLTWGLGAEVLGTVEEDFNFALGERDKRKFLIGGLSGQLGLDKTDSLLDPTKGFRAQILAQPEGALSDGFRPYLRSQLDGSAYYPVGKSVVLAGRARVGTTLGIDRFELAPSRRFYAGGGGSVRGFGFQELGPKDPGGRPIGGLSLTEAAAEVRYRFGDFGVVGFVDMGQVYEQRVPDFRGLRTGAGIGGRYHTNFGPLRVDVATPLGRKQGESRFNIYVSIGQAF
ncbi:BamA/TamA family outer membrane protein [Sphingomonas sp. GCM10030256]|uniref:autotransporter assembly complex protein TamA n=1 Tax=Sphingomonas sp. GCM10030256 TaxID=3273427 RepID=UPI00361935E5